MAVKNCLHAEKYAKNLLDFCVAVKLKIDNGETILCVFSNSAADSTNRYISNTVSKLFKLFPINTPLIICGDWNFAQINWKTVISTDDEEQEVLDLIKNNILKQTIDFLTCSKNILDVAMYKNLHIHAERIYKCSENTPIRPTVEVPHTESKPRLEIFRSLGNANFHQMCKMMRTKPYNLVGIQIFLK